jgi:hypothetical protein
LSEWLRHFHYLFIQHTCTANTAVSVTLYGSVEEPFTAPDTFENLKALPGLRTDVCASDGLIFSGKFYFMLID